LGRPGRHRRIEQYDHRHADDAGDRRGIADKIEIDRKCHSRDNERGVLKRSTGKKFHGANGSKAISILATEVGARLPVMAGTKQI
jgi:hypothetical protein